MNERIKELWEQANTRFVNDYQLSGKPREEWRNVPDMFAELIIKECADLADDKAPKDPWAVGVKIKQHFGVE